MKLHITIPATALRTVVRYCLLTIAISCLGLYGYVSIERRLYQAYQSRQFDRELGGAAIDAADDRGTSIDRSGQPARNSAHFSKLSSPNDIIGRLSVPRLHLSAMVREGIDDGTLRLAAGHIPSTVMPGQPGNVGVAGHRDTFFRGLKDLRAEDEIRFSTLTGDFKYVVDSLIVVEPDNVAVLASSTGNVLTLVTCYPFSYIGSAPKRFIVRARQVSPQLAVPSAVE